MSHSEDILLPEARAFVECRRKGNHADVMTLARAIRASSIAEKLREEKGLLSRHTNCLGVNLQLQSLIDPLYDPVMGLVMRFGWQPSNDLSGIHLVTLTHDPKTGNRMFTDPMPTTGYMYGTQGVAIETGEGMFKYIDEAIQSTSLVKQLNIQEVAAIGTHYFAKGYVEQDESKAAVLANEAMSQLSNVPGYLARNCLLLDMINDDKSYTLLNNTAPIEGIRSTQAALVHSKSYQAVLWQRDRELKANVNVHIYRSNDLIRSSSNIYQKNYWSGVRDELTLGFTAMSALSHASLSYKDFGGDLPVLTYERYMLENHLGYCRSDLYDASTTL